MTITYFDRIHFVNQLNGQLMHGAEGQLTRPYDRLDHTLSVTDHIAWLHLLENKRNETSFFYHQPWELLRKFYRDEGDLDAVRQINRAYDQAKAKFDYKTASRPLKPFVGLKNILYDKLAGHGHNLFRVVPWLFACMALFWAWSFMSYHTAHIVPTASRIYMNACYLQTKPLSECVGWEEHSRGMHLGDGLLSITEAEPVRLPDGYPAFHSFLYTLDTFIPFADLHQEAYWTVTDDGPLGEWMRAIFSVFIGLGGILSAIFAAAMFGLIRKS